MGGLLPAHIYFFFADKCLYTFDSVRYIHYICIIFVTLSLQKMKDVIKHRGTVEKINGSHVQVRIVQTSACSACSIKGHCNASESKEKLVDVYDAPSGLSVGQEVVVVGAVSMGLQAVLVAFGVPFLVLIVALLVAMKLTGDELTSALVAVLSLLPAYGLIYAFRGKLKNRFSFTLETINNQ